MDNKVIRLINNYTKKRESEKKRLQNETRVSRRRTVVFGSVLLVIVLLLLLVGVNQKKANQELQTEVAATSEVLDERNKKHDDLEQQIKQLNDDNYILRIARSEFFLSEEGELIFNLPEREEKENKEDKE